MTTPAYNTIQVERRDGVASIGLNQPPLNILDIAMMNEIREALETVETDQEVRAVVFRAAGEKAFCAGVSIQDHAPDKIAEMIPIFHGIFRLLARTQKVTVAAVQGHCLGGGLELAAMCDLVVASDNAQFGQPEIKLGQLPPVGIILLPYLIGYRKAAEMLLTGKSISATQAEAAGLVNRVVPQDQLMRGAEELLAEMSPLSGSALVMTKQILRRVQGLDFERLLSESEEFFLGEVVQTQDAREGILAFLEKRSPHWTHKI